MLSGGEKAKIKNIVMAIKGEYPKILEVLDIPKYETINLHVSLLPKYRGANPIQRAIINGDKETGICTMITELGLDCGDICMTHPITITPKFIFQKCF